MGRAEAGEALELRNSQLQYIARISGGKDGLKMLDVIVTRGLPLDRITTTDVWATDTIRGEHPKMVEFKDQVDEYIWRKYRIEVEHLCAMRNGEKLTYEKLFYHVPKRKNKPKKCGGGGDLQQQILGFPTLWGPWCQSDLKRDVRTPPAGLPCTNRELVQEAQNGVSTASPCLSTGWAHGARSSRPGF